MQMRKHATKLWQTIQAGLLDLAILALWRVFLIVYFVMQARRWALAHKGILAAIAIAIIALAVYPYDNLAFRMLGAFAALLCSWMVILSAPKAAKLQNQWVRAFCFTTLLVLILVGIEYNAADPADLLTRPLGLAFRDIAILVLTVIGLPLAIAAAYYITKVLRWIFRMSGPVAQAMIG